MDSRERLTPPAADAAGAGAGAPGGGATPEFLERFGPSTRALHWLIAIPVLLLMLTGLTNFWPEAKALHLGGARLLAWLHVLLGLGFVVALVPGALTLFSRRPARRDARDLFVVRLDDYLWLQHRALRVAGLRSIGPRVGKFNAGQKINAALSTVAVLLLLGTGVALGVNFWSKEVIDADLVAVVFRWHTVLSLLLLPLILGHLYMAVLNPETRESMRGITRGRVRRSWAERHHGAWAQRVPGESASGRARPPD